MEDEEIKAYRPRLNVVDLFHLIAAASLVLAMLTAIWGVVFGADRVAAIAIACVLTTGVLWLAGAALFNVAGVHGRLFWW